MCVDVRQKISERNFNRSAFARAPSSSSLKRRLSLSLSLSRASRPRRPVVVVGSRFLLVPSLLCCSERCRWASGRVASEPAPSPGQRPRCLAFWIYAYVAWIRRGGKHSVRSPAIASGLLRINFATTLHLRLAFCKESQLLV